MADRGCAWLLCDLLQEPNECRVGADEDGDGDGRRVENHKSETIILGRGRGFNTEQSEQ